MTRLENESLFLSFRRFFPVQAPVAQEVRNEDEILEGIRDMLDSARRPVGLLLSAGTDSAILAALLPRRSFAYTIEFPGHQTEYEAARQYVRDDVVHKRIVIERDEFFRAVDRLICAKRMPVVPHEAAVLVACERAKEDGVESMATGVGADGRFGGFPDLYRARTFRGFVRKMYRRYHDPRRILKKARSTRWVFERYRAGGQVDVQRFLNEVGTEGNAVESAIRESGLDPVQPYARMRYASRFDTDRILSGDEKYLLNNVFRRLYPGVEPATKFAFSIPYKEWLQGYAPHRPEFREDIPLARMSGKRVFLVYSLERYFSLMGIESPSSWDYTFLRGYYRLRRKVRDPIWSVCRRLLRGQNQESGA